MSDKNSPLVIQAKGLVKRYGQVTALDGADFELRAGEMVALAGLRGAGQEEIGRLLFACRPQESGQITLSGVPFTATTPGEAMSAGVSFVAGDRLHESLIPGMMVRENLFMNPCKHGHAPLSRYNEKSEAPMSWEKIRQFDVRPAQINIEISALSGGNQQKVVMARWLSLNAPLLILEDPSAGVDVGARAEIYDLLNQALQNATPLRIQGSNSKGFLGRVTAGEILDTRSHRGIVSYDPTELVLTARAGTPLREIEAALHQAGQMLPCEPPHLGPDATLGGMVAAGISGPRRPWSGSVRDYVLGTRVITGHGKLLRFAPWRPGQPLAANRYGIPEPDVDPAQALPPEEMALVVAPLTGFDAHCRRLGMGGGWYDRSFAFRQRRSAPPWLVGVGFAAQQVPALPVEDWDVAVDALCTEQATFYPEPSHA